MIILVSVKIFRKYFRVTVRGIDDKIYFKVSTGMRSEARSLIISAIKCLFDRSVTFAYQ